VAARGSGVSAVSAVTHVHTGPDAPTGSGGMPGCPQQLGHLLSGAGRRRSSSSSFLGLLPVLDESLQFKAGLVQAQGGRNKPGRGGRGCAYICAKTIPLGVALWSGRSLFSAQLWFPSSAGNSWSSAAPSMVIWHGQLRMLQPLRTGETAEHVAAGVPAAHSVHRHPEPGQWRSYRTN